MKDRLDLDRFVQAQNSGGIQDLVVAELRSGRKTSHWMWFVFPQVAGLGHSALSKLYAIRNLDEARAYLEHPVLRPRLLQVSGIVADQSGVTAVEIFGSTDARKLNSSMTLFLRAAPAESVFSRVLGLLFDGRTDAATDRILEHS